MRFHDTAPRLLLALFVVLAPALLFNIPSASANPGFRKWISNFRSVAAKNGIRKSTYDKAFAGVKTHDPEVLRKARHQPEFKEHVWSYVDTRVHSTIVKKGQRPWGASTSARWTPSSAATASIAP